MVPLGFFLTSMALPAWTMLVYWLLIQFVGGAAALGGEGGASRSGRTSAASSPGAALVKLFALPDYVARHQAHHWRPQRLMRS